MPADDGDSVHAHVLEPQWSAVLAIQKLLAICEAAGDASLAFGNVRTVEEGYVLVSDIPEPVYPAFIFEQPQRDTVDWRVAPSLVEETSCAIEVVEVVAVLLTPPEAKVADFEVRPEVACGVAVGSLVVVGCWKAELRGTIRSGTHCIK
jgi:hypothetical protein